jgi:Predicted integral membrane protein (DUF2269)
MYQFIVFIHVLCAVIALGANTTYVVWLTRGRMQRDQLLFALRGIKFIDGRIANPAYGLLLLTGIAQVLISHRTFHQTWLEWAVLLWVVLAAIAYGMYSPGLRKQIALLETGTPDAPAFVALERRQNAVGAVLFTIAVVILALMVFRPGGA